MCEAVQTFEGFRQGVVEDPAHVGLVDAHPKGHGRCKDERFSTHPRLLYRLAIFWRAVSVVVVHKLWVFAPAMGASPADIEPLLLPQLLTQVNLHALPQRCSSCLHASCSHVTSWNNVAEPADGFV
jgi:hypothetical protein